MSWTASVDATPADEFDAAVSTCVTCPSEDGLADEPKAQLGAAREAAKALAGTFDGAKPIRASLSGHACVEGQDGTDSISVLVSETATPAA